MLHDLTDASRCTVVADNLLNSLNLLLDNELKLELVLALSKLMLVHLKYVSHHDQLLGELICGISIASLAQRGYQIAVHYIEDSHER